jgi:hypothetical protein
VGLLTNDGSSHDLYQNLYAEIFRELCGVEIQDPLKVPAQGPSLDISPWLGVYERASAQITIYEQDGAPRFKAVQKGELAQIEANPVMYYEMRPVREGLWAVYVEDLRTDAPVWFYQLESGGRYIHFGARATQKVA